MSSQVEIAQRVVESILAQKLAQIPDDTVLYPGHLYSPEPSAALGEVRQRNYAFRPRTKDQWMMMFGHEGI